MSFLKASIAAALSTLLLISYHTTPIAAVCPGSAVVPNGQNQVVVDFASIKVRARFIWKISI
jgi:hypothetical protein